MLITTTMTFFVIRYGWKYPWWLCVAATGFFFVVDFVFFAANVVKVLDGGWFPLLIGAVMFTLMMTWKQGRKLMSREPARRRDRPRRASSSRSSSARRRASPGTAVFLVSEPGPDAERAAAQPEAQQGAARAQPVRHRARTTRCPWIALRQALRDRAARQRLLAGDAALRLQERARRARGAGAAATAAACSVDEMETSYFLSRDIVIPTLGGGMALWREKLFASMHRNAAAAADFLSLPTNRSSSWAKVRSEPSGAGSQTALKLPTMKLLFVADPLETLQDLQGHDLRDDARGRGARPRALRLRAEGPGLAARRPRQRARARDRAGRRRAAPPGSSRPAAPASMALADADAVLMRKDPPFDSEYFYATHLLEQAEREGARVFNSPRALRDHPEKLAILEFPQFIAPTIVTRDAAGDQALPRRAPRHRPEAARRHGRHGHLPRRRRRPQPRQHHRDAQPRRRDDGDGAALPDRDRRRRQAHPRHRRRAGAVLRWRASRRAARSAATSPSAARASRSR